MTCESKPKPDRPMPETRREWIQTARQTGEADTFAGKRRQERFTWFPQLEVRMTTRSGQTETLLASGHDISEGGVRFFCRIPMDVFTKVEVVVEGEADGVAVLVKHCTRTFNGYLIGADFVD
ncbi:MAG TPA: hypothetical protein VM243_13620 [Phycisphaerae bacterium]|nr:hypothetical protein [Phycisphaerae bacterium]